MEIEKQEINQWIKGIPYELAFWNNVYRWMRTDEGLVAWSNYERDICLEGIDANSILSASLSCNREATSPLVLDVGSGMSYLPGNYFYRGERRERINMKYIDPLAYHYNKILNKYHRELPEITFGIAEYLSAFLPNEKADMIIIQNALDHSFSPIKGIIEAMRTLHMGGYLYLNHHPNEAEMELYKGFHKYNINEENGKLVIWNKTVRFIVDDFLQGFSEINVHRTDNGHIVALIRKTNNVPENLYDDSTSIKDLCENYHQLFMLTFSKNLSAKLKCKYCLYNVIQFLAQALPWDIKMKVKKFIGQA